MRSTTDVLLAALDKAGVRGVAYCTAREICGSDNRFWYALKKLFADGLITRSGRAKGQNGILYLAEHAPPAPTCGACGSTALVRHREYRKCKACGKYSKAAAPLPPEYILAESIYRFIGLTKNGLRYRIITDGIDMFQVRYEAVVSQGVTVNKTVLAVSYEDGQKLMYPSTARKEGRRKAKRGNVPKKETKAFPPPALIAEARALKARCAIPEITQESLVITMKITRNLARAIADAARA